MRPAFISEAFIRRILTPPVAYRLAEDVFRRLGKGQAQMPPKIYLNLPSPAHDDFRAMPAFVGGPSSAACGLKWVSVFPRNPSRKLPTVYGTILLNSCKTGKLLAVVEANTITALRTAAASAVATRWLAVKKPKVLAILGAGVQARFQLEALAALYHFSEIRVWGPRRGEAERFCRRRFRVKNPVAPFRDLRRCIEGADILTTCTPTRRPLVRRSWIKPGAHINAIGADAKGKQELETALTASAKVVVDEWEQASHSGEINRPVALGRFSRKNLCAELSAIVTRKKRGRKNAAEITLFDSTGLAVLDIAFADYVYRAYGRRQR